MSAQSQTLGGPTRLIARYSLFGVAVFLCLILPLAAYAETAISRSYATDGKLPLGTVVSLKANSTDEVVAASANNVDGLLGVTITEDSSLLSVTNGQKNQVQVATSGTAQVIVSDINGKVARGDHITASPIAGVGMKATGNVRIVGVAQGDVGGSSKQKYKDKDGKEHEVTLGQVPILINVAYYFKEPDKTLIPQAVQNLANALAGKVVSPVPILISAGIFVIMVIVVASIIYSMIKSSIISVGRNPMSQAAVYRGVVQLSALVIVILGVGLSAMYLVLTRL
ncbi:MAG TPA: hypothetical protein VLA88_01070 [Candidatus Saccharimonadales bacterium]|nr:hypothetical protein [Candidatus Saccharimonadales bacterium]